MAMPMPNPTSAGSTSTGMVYGRAISEVAAWYRQAADQDHLVAQLNLGLLYDNGQGVRQDHVEAAAGYCKAAEQGNADAQFNLGGLYNDGQGVRREAMQGQRLGMKRLLARDMPMHNIILAALMRWSGRAKGL